MRAQAENQKKNGSLSTDRVSGTDERCRYAKNSFHPGAEPEEPDVPMSMAALFLVIATDENILAHKSSWEGAGKDDVMDKKEWDELCSKVRARVNMRGVCDCVSVRV
jgi:hypothetical protein